MATSAAITRNLAISAQRRPQPVPLSACKHTAYDGGILHIGVSTVIRYAPPSRRVADRHLLQSPATGMKIDVHAHQIEQIFFDALRSLPGVTVKVNPDRFSYLIKDGRTWLPFRPEMFDPDHLIREMDRKGIDVAVLSMNTPSVYIFESGLRIDLARRLNDAMIARAKRDPNRILGFATLPLPDIEAALNEIDRIAEAPGIVGIAVGSNFRSEERRVGR